MVETSVVREQLQVVLDAMARLGYVITQPVEVKVDEKLPFMGYTSRQWEKHVIVVSGFATQSLLLWGLLTHELSHVYRNLSNHPSHNEEILANATGSFTQVHGLSEDYQRQVLHQAINHIQDLYADDIAVRVIQSNPQMRAPLESLGEFFLGWIKDKPVKTNSKRKDSWLNAGILLNNCFAVSNIQRRGIKSYAEKAQALNGKFLMKISPGARANFAYFNRFMVTLSEEVTGNEFRQQLDDYLERFWETVESI